MPFDWYPTPEWAIKRVLAELEHLPGGLWFEPCAGEGALVKSVRREREDVRWHLTEIREEAVDHLRAEFPEEVVVCGSALDESTCPTDPSVVITNPPFSIAWELIHCLLARYPAAHVVLLLRLNFLGSEGRSQFLRDYPPDVYVLPNRPSFAHDGRTDSTEYAWLHWLPAPRARPAGRLVILPATPAEERYGF